MNSKRETLIKGWPVRLLIVGRDGSGRKFQAAQVAKEKGLIMLDLDYEFIKYLQSGKMYPFPFHLFKRISKHEFQHNGWICVAHPAMIQDLQCLFENLAEQPTKVLFIHTSQKACLRRIDGAIKRHFCHLGDDGNFTVEHLARQMHLYDLHKKEFVEYFRGRRPIVPILHIDGNQARRKITTLILASI